MYEAMQLQQEGKRTYSFKIRMGYFKNLNSAINFAKKHVTPGATPYIMTNGKCVWSPLTERLGA
jgi:hypothetical protein